MEKYLVTVKNLASKEVSDKTFVCQCERLENLVREYVSKDSICIVAAMIEEYDCE